MKTLKELRESISSIDEEILKLLAKRKDHILQIKSHKKNLQIPVQDLKRETEMQTKRDEIAKKYGLNPQDINPIFTAILNWSKNIQSHP